MYIAPTIRSIKYTISDRYSGLDNARNVRAASKALAIAEAQAKVFAAKQELLATFDKHPVTKELKAKPGSKSALLGGYGDLFSYVGFVEGTEPAVEIRTFLEESIRVEPEKTRKTNTVLSWGVTIVIPDIEDFDREVAQMEWVNNKSFVSQIEKGIPGIARYMSIQGRGRSGGGIQTKGDIGGDKKEGRGSLTQPQAEYMTPILKKFTREFE